MGRASLAKRRWYALDYLSPSDRATHFHIINDKASAENAENDTT